MRILEVTLLNVLGYGYHGDFISGWDEQTLGQAVKTCTNPSGRIDDCPVFNIQSQSDTEKCDMNIPHMLADEDVKGPMASLPGGIHLGEFVGDLVDGVASVVAGGHAAAIDGSVGVPSSSPATGIPGVGIAQAPTSENPVDPASTPIEVPTVQPTSAAPIPEAPAPQGPVSEEPTSEPPVVTKAPEPVAPEEEVDIVSTEYIRDGNVLSKIVWVEEVEYVTETEYKICTQTIEPPNAKRAHAHMRRHLHRHR